MTPTPTTQQLNDQIITDLAGALGQTIPFLPKSFLRVLARVLAAVVVLLFKYAGFIFLQLFVATATYEEVTILGQRFRPLERWGILLGVGTKNAATPAELAVSVPVLTQGGTLKAGQKLVRSETGVIYEVAFPVTLNAATVTATVRPISDAQGGDGAGTIGNLTVGDALSFANAPADVASQVTVSSVLKTGQAAETVEAYRARIIQRAQRKPQGGAYADYQQWGEEADGIAHVYPYSGLPGEIDLYVESATEVDGIPTGPQLDAVWYAVQYTGGVTAGLANRRPINAAVNVKKITRTAFDVVVAGLAPDTSDNRAAIEDGLKEYFLSREPYIEGLSTLPRSDRVTEAEVSGLVAGIVNARGATVNGVTLVGGPAQTLGPGQKAKLGNPGFA